MDYIVVYAAKRGYEAIIGSAKCWMENSPPKFDELIEVSKLIQKENGYKDVTVVNIFPVS